MRSRALLCAAAVLLAACKAGPDYRKPDVPVSAAYKETGEAWKQAKPRDDADRGKWWEIFADAELSRLVERIDVSNQSLRAAEAQVRQAQAVSAGAQANLFPTLDLSGSVVRSRTGGATQTNRVIALDASWDADLWGRLRRALESSDASVQASAGDLAAARLSLQAQLATNYFLLRTLDRQRQLLDETVGAFQKNLTLTENRYRAGVGARADVVQAEAQLLSTQAQAIDLAVQRSQLEHAIAVLVGVPPSELAIPMQTDYTPTLPVVPVDCLRSSSSAGPTSPPPSGASRPRMRRSASPSRHSFLRSRSRGRSAIAARRDRRSSRRRACSGRSGRRLR
jgi:NodT family efflux transporter outer membrane factor (OMF) lipoprotein